MAATKDDLGDRMKAYEAHQTQQHFMKQLPIYVRLDGRGFSKFTRSMTRPYDPRMLEAMQRTATTLLEKNHAVAAYTQSDEISLLFYAPFDPIKGFTPDFLFDGKIQKLTSVLAGQCTAAFIDHLFTTFGHIEATDYLEKLPHFDCRVFQLPNLDEAANAILWRHLDCTRNAIQMVGQHHFSQRDLQGVSTRGILLKLAEDCRIKFEEDFPAEFRYGTFLRRENEYSTDSFDTAPMAEPTPVVTRTKTKQYHLDFRTLSNRVDFVFSNAAPEERSPTHEAASQT